MPSILLFFISVYFVQDHGGGAHSSTNWAADGFHSFCCVDKMNYYRLKLNKSYKVNRSLLSITAYYFMKSPRNALTVLMQLQWDPF